MMEAMSTPGWVRPRVVCNADSHVILNLAGNYIVWMLCRTSNTLVNLESKIGCDDNQSVWLLCLTPPQVLNGFKQFGNKGVPNG